MTRTWRVLVFPGGTEIGLEIHRALSHRRDIRLYSAGSGVSNHAPYVFARHSLIPDVHDPAWLDALNGIIAEHAIDYVFPAHDDVVVALARNADTIEAKIVSSPLETCLICRSKSRTYRLLADVVPVPTVYEDVDDIVRYPVFLKPDEGQGSGDTHIVHGRAQLAQLLTENRRHVVLEYLPGEEYTVDCFSDRDAGLSFCGGRQRVRIRSGISMNSRPVQDDVFLKYAKQICKKLTFHGAWFFQLKTDRYGTYKVLEVAPRIAGTMAIHRVRGVNFALLSIYEQERMPIEIAANDAVVEIDRALVNRYRHRLEYRVVYVDLDDTLIVNGTVNTMLVRFLYQCINKRIRLVLLTRHDGDVGETLRKHRLLGVFDEVVHLDLSAVKSDHINESASILIDDSFAERKAVAEKLGIVTFDCSMVEMLLDERA